MTAIRFIFIVLLLTLGCSVGAQQPNSAEASFRIDGFDDQSYPLSAVLASSGSHALTFDGGALHAFSLFHGPINAGFFNAGALGLADIDFTSAGFSVLLNGLNPQSPLDAMAVLDATGHTSIQVQLAPGLSGSLGGLQALFADPTLPQGFRLSAASTITVVSTYSLGIAAPSSGSAGGGLLVNITGVGFTSGVPVTVKFGDITAPFATAISSTLITATTPPSVPGTTVDITVTHGGATQVIIAGFAFDPSQHPKVLINEINTGSPDYVELYNPNPVSVDISGWSLHSWYHGTTPDTGGPHFFPFGTILPAGGTLIIQEQGQAQMPGTLPLSVSTGYDFWWSGTRQIEVALLDDLNLGVDYLHRKWSGALSAPNLPFPLTWTGEILSSDDHIWRHSSVDTDDAGDFSVSAASGTPGTLNPGQ